MSWASRGFSESIREHEITALKLEDFYLRSADPRLAG